MRIGSQIPMAGGLLVALDYAIATGCETVQIFSKSPRRWASPPLDAETCALFRAGCDEAGIGPVFAHASYLISMGSDDPVLWERSIASLADEFARAALVGASGVVLHLGRRFSDDDRESVEHIADAASRAAEIAGPGIPALLLENTAGAGRQFGGTVAEMTAALTAVRERGVTAGLCIDTCHALAGGIDLRTEADWSRMLAEIEACCGARTVALVHANDSKGELGSHRDRHEWIGDGFLGMEAFRAMFAQVGLSDASAVVEMSGVKPFRDEENLRRLRLLRAAASGPAGPGPEPV